MPAYSTLFDSGFPYYSKLYSHTSCINALAFSSSGGRFLASGGDDLNIHVWDFNQEDVDRKENGPKHTFVGPRGNIFTLGWSSGNKYLFAGGTDFTIYKYDVSSLHTNSLLSFDDKLPKWRFHERDTVRDISCHPSNDEIFLSGSESGRILLHDLREPQSQTEIDTRTRTTVKATHTIQLASEVTGVRYNPNPSMEHLFVTSESSGRVCLRDSRMGFGSRMDGRRGDGVVLQYNTTLKRFSDGKMCRPEASSVTFDTEGEKLGVTMLHFYPTMYALSDPDPLAVCTTGLPRPYSASPYPYYTEESDGTPNCIGFGPSLGTIPPLTSTTSLTTSTDSSRPESAGRVTRRRTGRFLPPKGYTNSCTMKHGSFGRAPPIPTSNSSFSRRTSLARPNPNSYSATVLGGGAGSDADYYAGGSDDFCGYVWKIPSVERLKGAREGLNSTFNPEIGDSARSDPGVGFLKSGPNPGVCVPVELSTPCAVLEGHKSITNTTLFHPTFPLILTCGIERYVYIHSPVESNPFCARLRRCGGAGQQSSKEKPPLSSSSEEKEIVGDAVAEMDTDLGTDGEEDDHDADDGSESEEDEEEIYTIRIFDSILRTEGRVDPFDVRAWNGVDDEEEEDSDNDMAGDDGLRRYM